MYDGYIGKTTDWPSAAKPQRKLRIFTICAPRKEIER
jgi:hypothetical protein